MARRAPALALWFTPEHASWFVRVPSVAEEQLRDLVRAREDIRGELSRARQRLSHFLRRRDLRFGATKAWSERHRRWLRSLRFDDLASEATFADYLSAVDGLLGRRETLERTLAELAPQSPWSETIARLRCFRGIDLLSATGLCAEIGDFDRFGHPSQLAGFLGLVPCERTSDQKRRLGSITKAGPKHSRRLLVEAAQHAWRRPAVSEELRRRQAGQDPRVCEIAWRAQQPGAPALLGLLDRGPRDLHPRSARPDGPRALDRGRACRAEPRRSRRGDR